MTNARCLTEGVDLPAIDCVCFTDPKRSKVDIVQAAGRALRLSKGKKFGYILIPIFIPAGADFIEAAEEQGFDDVAITVRALAVTDTRITEYLRAISEGKKPRGGSPVEGITSANSLYKIEAEEFDKAIKLKVWDKVSYGNWRSYEDAKKYVQELKIKSKSAYENAYAKGLLTNLPSSPFYYQRFSEWKSLSNFLSTDNIAPYKLKYLSLEKHYEFAKSNKIKNKADWKKICKIKPKNIHAKPDKKFKDNGWISYPHFFGNTHVTNKSEIFSFQKANKLIKKFNIKSKSDYFKKYEKGLLKGFPSAPDYYNKEKNWKGAGKFLGTNTIAPQKMIFRSFEEHKKFTRTLNLKNSIEWEKFCESGKKPIDIYVAVKYKFPKEWKGWPDFLGKKK
jgi:hypothetical protein